MEVPITGFADVPNTIDLYGRKYYLTGAYDQQGRMIYKETVA